MMRRRVRVLARLRIAAVAEADAARQALRCVAASPVRKCQPAAAPGAPIALEVLLLLRRRQLRRVSCGSMLTVTTSNSLAGVERERLQRAAPDRSAPACTASGSRSTPATRITGLLAEVLAERDRLRRSRRASVRSSGTCSPRRWSMPTSCSMAARVAARRRHDRGSRRSERAMRSQIRRSRLPPAGIRSSAIRPLRPACVGAAGRAPASAPSRARSECARRRASRSTQP